MKKSLIASVVVHGSVVLAGAMALGWSSSGDEAAERLPFQISLPSPPSHIVPDPQRPPEPIEPEPEELEIEVETLDLAPVEFELAALRRPLISTAPTLISHSRLRKPLRVKKPPAPKPPVKKPTPPRAAAPPAAHVDSPPSPQTCTAPAYPALARRLGHEGTVKVLVAINAAGTVTSARIYKSSGSRILDGAAMRAARAWKFRPATKNGKAIAGSLVQPVVFRLS